MYGIYIIFFFILLALINNIFFYNDNDTTSEIEIDNKYLPPGYLIGTIWIIIFAILGFIYSKINIKNDKNYLSRISIMFFVAFCFMYGPLTIGKTSRFIKNYNYLSFIFLCTLYLIIQKSSLKYKYYLLPIFIWIGYISLLTLLDDLKYINLYIN